MDILYRWILIYDEAGSIVDLNFTAIFIFLIVVYSAWMFVDSFLGVSDDTVGGGSLVFAAFATIATSMVLIAFFGTLILLGRWSIFLLVPILAAVLGKYLRERIG